MDDGLSDLMRSADLHSAFATSPAEMSEGERPCHLSTISPPETSGNDQHN